MTTMQTFGLTALAALAFATPAIAGPTEAAVAQCKAELIRQLDTGSGTPALTIKKIEPGAKVTRVRIAANSRDVIDCRIDYRGALVSAELNGRAKEVQQANR